MVKNRGYKPWLRTVVILLIVSLFHFLHCNFLPLFHFFLDIACWIRIEWSATCKRRQQVLSSLLSSESPQLQTKLLEYYQHFLAHHGLAKTCSESFVSCDHLLYSVKTNHVCKIYLHYVRKKSKIYKLTGEGDTISFLTTMSSFFTKESIIIVIAPNVWGLAVSLGQNIGYS